MASGAPNCCNVARCVRSGVVALAYRERTGSRIERVLGVTGQRYRPAALYSWATPWFPLAGLAQRFNRALRFSIGALLATTLAVGSGCGLSAVG